jgi:predicted GNAT superfamily acetyltransferase
MILIRECRGFDELEACVQMQVETWGYDQSDVIPRKAFLVAQKIGGQVIGAFDTELAGADPQGGPESLVGFAFSLPGVKTASSSDRCFSAALFPENGEPQPYLHSPMLAVREGYRNRGLGRQLKLKQRDEALSRGIRHMEWTFDPLEIKNAFLNIHKLGAIVCAYFVDFYGVSSSRLQGGLPTDRLMAQWHLDSARVKAIVENRAAAGCILEEQIVIPASIYEWKASESGRERALAVQLENREKFRQAFSKGLAVLGFLKDADGNGVFQLGPPNQANSGILLQGQ